MARRVPELSDTAREELHAVLVDRMTALRDRQHAARAKGDLAAFYTARADMTVLRRAAKLLGCPVSPAVGRKRSIHDIILSTLRASPAPLGIEDLLKGLGRDRPQTVQAIQRNSVWVALYRLEAQGLIRSRGEHGKRMWQLTEAVVRARNH